MIKLTNAQASAFNSPIIQKLFQDENRHFPMADAFLLSDVIKGIQDRLKAYFDQMRAIVEANHGTIDEQGRVTYGENGHAQKAAEEIAALNDIALEYIGDKVKPSSDWPKLSLAEALILNPILDLKKKIPDE